MYPTLIPEIGMIDDDVIEKNKSIKMEHYGCGNTIRRNLIKWKICTIV